MSKKEIILGKSGAGKTFRALDMVSQNNGTTIIVSNSVYRETYEPNFPFLNDFENKNIVRPFRVQKNHKYYIHQEDIMSGYSKNLKDMVDFVNARIFVDDYECIGNDENATVLYTDGAWDCSNNDGMTLWQMSSVKCNIIITAESLTDILKIGIDDITPNMKGDIMRYWNITEL